MPRVPLPPPTPPICRDTLGVSPATLAKRELNNASNWCPKPPNSEYDRYSNPKHPKTVHYNNVMKAYATLKSIVPATPLLKSKSCQKLNTVLYFKVETRHTTGSFHERSAMYVLRKLSSEQRKAGVFTASVGNWAMALAHQGHLLKIPVTVVLPVCTRSFVVHQCRSYGAMVVLYGKNIDEAKTFAFKLIADQSRGGTYLNGFDHPNVIAGAGCIGVEILEQLPETDAILVPIGGGGLIAGIATVVKHIKPAVLIYGIEPGKSCSFAKAIDNERPYRTAVEKSLASSLTVPKAGDNAFHTARSLVDKLVLIHDDWTARAILHLIEEENIVAEGAGAISLGALLCIPNILPELHGKTVVCIVSGGNIDLWQLKRAILYGKAAEGRIFTITIRMVPGKDFIRNKILKLIKHMQCNIIYSEMEQHCLEEDKLLDSYEDFDENCDPECPKILRYEDVVDAAQRIRSQIITTPVMKAHTKKDFGINIHYKLEAMQRSGSFKERGSLNVLHLLPPDKKKLGIVLASSGNAAISMSFHAAKMNIPVTVVMPVTLAIDKMQRCHGYGAKVIVQGANLAEAQKYARNLARDKGLTFINGRDHPQLLAGYGSMALEILETTPFLDALIVPVGTGGLAAAMATVIKHQKPSVLIYGVQPELAPTFFNSLENDEPVTLQVQNSMADAITVSNIGCNSFAATKPLLDKMLLVKEDWIARAMLHLSEREKYIVEGAGACTLAAILGNLVPELKTKNVVCLLTGGNVDNIMLVRCLERGLAAEGRLVKFRVGVRNDALSKCKLMTLIAAGGYNIYRHFQDNSWTEGSDFFVEMKVVCETKGLAHALELKRTIERAYPCTSIFETEPFSDKRTCPCYTKK